jgi:integrase/recombinase XerD
MSSFPCLARFVSGSGQVRYRLGDRLVDRYLEFVAGRCRPNTLRAVAFDLKAFFTVIPKDPVAVTAADVFEFLAHQRGDRTVVRLADRESGLSARTIARRLSSVSGLYAYLVARGDTPVGVNPVPRGLLTRRQGGSRRSRTAPLVRVLGSGLAVWRNVSLMSLTGVLLGDRQGMRQSCGLCHMRRRWHKKVART